MHSFDAIVVYIICYQQNVTEIWVCEHPVIFFSYYVTVSACLSCSQIALKGV